MKFKTLSMLLTLVAALCLIGCTKDPAMNGSENGGQEDSGRKIFLSAGIALPTSSSTRSQTDDYPNNDSTGDNDQTNSNEDKNSGNNDFEYGYNYESDVNSILMVLATTDNKYIAHTFVSNVSEAPTTNAKFDFVVTGELSYDDLEKAYEGTETGEGLLKDNQDVRIWVYCNYTGNLVKLFNEIKMGNTEWIDWNGTVNEEPRTNPNVDADIPNTIWAKNSFLMTNANNVDNKFTFPASLPDWDPYTDKSNPYKLCDAGTKQTETSPLTPIRVERAAARIDFKDASDYGDDKPNTYALKYVTKRATTDSSSASDVQTRAEEQSLNLYSVTLNRMSLVNMSNQFYYLRRVSDDGLGKSEAPATDNKFEVGGYEYYRTVTGSDGSNEYKWNYVVDVDHEVKNTQAITPSNAATYFNFPLFNAADNSYNNTKWYVSKINDILEGETDNWGSKEYHIWRYVTENTIPGEENQITVQSTGVVFKGSIILGKDAETGVSEDLITEKVKEALESEVLGNTKTSKEEAYKVLPDLYSFEGRLYAGIEELVAAAVEAKGSTLNTGLDLALEHWVASATDKKFIYSETKKPTLSEDEVYLTSVICDKLINHKAELTDKDTYGDAGYKYKDYTIDFTKDYYESSSSGTLSEEEQALYDAAVYNFNKAVASVVPGELGVSVYRASNEEDGDGWGYYCYYFYWNRHNDNLKSGKMGPMEFATVRNNVYKLSVKTISEFGHPRVTDFDPEPVDPEDPDEDPKVYFQVQVEVLPWVVRVNEIEF